MSNSNADTTGELAELYLQTIVADFKGIKKLGDRALEQLHEQDINRSPDPESNSVAIIVKHMSGNMISRWTDFLTTDGEKENRNRDDEFVDDIRSKEQLLAIWNQGWSVLLNSLTALTADDVLKTVYIRKEPHTVLKAIQRQVSHYSYHVGQLVYLVKHLQSVAWVSLSIPRNQSSAFNLEMSQKHHSQAKSPDR